MVRSKVGSKMATLLSMSSEQVNRKLNSEFLGITTLISVCQESHCLPYPPPEISYLRPWHLSLSKLIETAYISSKTTTPMTLI